MTTPAAVTLDERLCLALYTASRAMTARYRPLLRDLGLTYPQYLVMVLLWEEGDASVGQVGVRLDLESSTLSPLLKRLEAMGLVTRTRASRDERSVTVGLTATGRALEARAAHVPAAICDATALSGKNQAALVAQLRTLAAELEASTAV
jgi:DNA-binding MarR family transcriptional regulator